MVASLSEVMLVSKFFVVLTHFPQLGVGVGVSKVIAFKGVVAFVDHHDPLGDRA